MRSFTDELDRQARNRREVYGSLATIMHKFVANCKNPGPRKLAKSIAIQFLSFVTTADYACSSLICAATEDVPDSPPFTKNFALLASAFTGICSSLAESNRPTGQPDRPVEPQPVRETTSLDNWDNWHAALREEVHFLIQNVTHRRVPRPKNANTLDTISTLNIFLDTFRLDV
ncbi:hypothetical protein N7535_003488 [Penicillium sp. DV-2018c]|nr:hypothetical protein N7461_000810 [Penicillium sp. DV-2018c]KAJ5576562.1 hypothetical protein N7535_003488 [Penicillium sp. DV-2018c]